MSKINQIYGANVFNDSVMQARLPRATYEVLSSTIKQGKPLDTDIAHVVAHAMKEWAIEKGATHYCHWFQPLTGITSEKHDSFISPKTDGTTLLRFSGKELIKGEPDASAFPSGGLRATFEARGYTAWDPTSFAFIKDEVLCIPTAFVSYTGEALDKKTPLLRSMEAIANQAKRVLKFFGKEPVQVYTTVGAEQEYFLIKEEDFEKRMDLILTGRTLFGAQPCKGQELGEHYFGAIRPNVNRFMKDLDDELWKLDIPAYTKHNELAPAQHELAPIFTQANTAIDGNLLTMEQMRILAPRQGLICLQHEKPFVGINGSGKHNNWSIAADGVNLLDPGKTPFDNLQFLVFLTAVIKAADEYQGLLLMSVASAGNDHRLGSHEAPPHIISVYLGEELEQVVRAIIDGTKYTFDGTSEIDLGTDKLPVVFKDNSDRNRTSPFAFTGNKFEFRMPGSSVNLSDCNTVLNTIIAKALADFSDAVEGQSDFAASARSYMKQVLTDHQRIIFNGDNYAKEWPAQAAERGLLSLSSTPEALKEYLTDASVKLFADFKVLSAVEIQSRYEVKLEHYSKVINIEALTTARLAMRTYLPAVIKYARELAASMDIRSKVGLRPTKAEAAMLEKLSGIIENTYAGIKELSAAQEAATKIDEVFARAETYCKKVLPAMNKVRAAIDEAELIVADEYWPVPTYNDMLFYT